VTTKGELGHMLLEETNGFLMTMWQKYAEKADWSREWVLAVAWSGLLISMTSEIGKDLELRVPWSPSLAGFVT